MCELGKLKVSITPSADKLHASGEFPSLQLLGIDNKQVAQSSSDGV